MKVCTKCKIEKPFGAFHRCKAKYDGYQSRCIECNKLRRVELKKNSLMQLEKEIRTSVILENKLLKRENKKLCQVCKEIFLIDDLIGGVICNECCAKYNRERYKKNKEKIRGYITKYKAKNREKISERKRVHYQKNKEKKREQQREYRLKKKLEMQNNN